MTPDPIVAPHPTPEMRDAIRHGLRGYNEAQAGAANVAPLAILIPGPGGETVGGLYGTSGYGWLFVELLFVPEQFRGQGLGSVLIRKAEEEARARGCIGVWLDTFSFQARGFYERLGYRVFGEIDDYPPGAARYFLKKRLG